MHEEVRKIKSGKPTRKELKESMAQVLTIDVTSILGSETFPVNANDVYGLIETIAVQNIRAVKSSNRIEDAFYDYVVENGAVIEEAIVEMAEKQAFVKTGKPDLSPKDPTLAVKYFNNWEEKQFQTTIRRSDIRKIIADKGTGFDELVAIILATLSEGEGYDDYKAMRDILQDEQIGFDASLAIFGDKHPKNMKGVIYCMREMYNALKATNKVGLGADGILQATPVEDIRIAVSESVLNLIDVVELANVFNLSKEELFGKLVVVPFDKSFNHESILVYDRKALGRGTRLFEYSQDVIGKGLYTNHYLTTERCYFYNGLFKALRLDISIALASGLAEVMEDNTYYTITETLSHATSDNEAEKVLAGKSFDANYEAEEGYTLEGASVSVTMGGNAVSGAYEDGHVHIESVSGNVVVTITAEAETPAEEVEETPKVLKKSASK